MNIKICPSSLLKTIEDSRIRGNIPDMPLGKRYKDKEDLVDLGFTS